MRQWEGSGLSAAAWCWENEVVYCQFLYWRERILDPTAGTFVELTEPKIDDSGIAIEVRGLPLSWPGNSTLRLFSAALSYSRHADSGPPTENLLLPGASRYAQRL